MLSKSDFRQKTRFTCTKNQILPSLKGFIKAQFHIWVATSLFRSFVGTFSKKLIFVGKLKQLRVSVNTLEATRFCVGNIKTKTSFCA